MRQQLMTRYLLGEASEQERDELESKYTSHPEVLAELVEVENDLIDDFAGGALSDADRKKFQSRYLKAAAGVRRVEFAGSLRSHIAERKTGAQQSPTRAGSRLPAKSLFRPLMATSGLVASVFALLIALGGFWLFLINRQLRNDLAQIREEQTRLRAGERQLKEQITKLSFDLAEVRTLNRATGRDRATIAALHLVPNLLRGNRKQPRIVLSPAISTVQLQLDLASNRYDTYRVLVRTAEGAPVWQKDNISRHPAGGIRLQIPASVLQNSDYVVKLYGAAPSGQFDEVAGYAFSAQRP